MTATTKSTETSVSVDDDEESSDTAYFWTDSRGRKYVGEGGKGGAIVPLHKLTAIAEHGIDTVKEADVVHHGLAAPDPDGGSIYIDVPDFLVPVDHGEHLSMHQKGEWADVDGIPVLLPES